MEEGQWRRVVAFLPISTIAEKDAVENIVDWLETQGFGGFTLSRVDDAAFAGYYRRDDNDSWEYDRTSVFIADEIFTDHQLRLFLEVFELKAHIEYRECGKEQEAILVTAYDLSVTTLEWPPFADRPILGE